MRQLLYKEQEQGGLAWRIFNYLANLVLAIRQRHDI